MELNKEAVEDFQAIINLQNWITDLDAENYSTVKQQILHSMFVKTDERVRVLINEFLTIFRIREFKTEINVDMIQSLTSSGSHKNNLDKFKTMLYTELSDWVSTDTPEPNLMLLRQCATKNIYSIDQIMTTILKFRPAEETVFPYVFLAFAPEIDSLQGKFYKTHIKILYKYNGDNPLIKRCIQRYPQELRRDRYKVLGQMYQFGYEVVSIQYVIKFDKVDILMQYAAMDDFDPNKKLENSAFDTITHRYMKNEELKLIELAALYGSEKCFKYLYENYKETLTDRITKYALIGGSTEIINIINKENKPFDTALPWAAAYRRNSQVEWIVKEKKPSQEILNKTLNKAIKYNSAQSVLFLLQNGAVPRNPGEKLASSSLAAKYGHLQILEFLHNCGFGHIQEDAEAACLYGKLHILQGLIPRGAELDKPNKDGKTLLHFAAEGGSHRVVNFLVKQGVNVNPCDNLKRYPIHYACMKNHYDVVKILLLNKSEVTGEDANGVAISEMATNEDVRLIVRAAKSK